MADSQQIPSGISQSDRHEESISNIVNIIFSLVVVHYGFLKETRHEMYT